MADALHRLIPRATSVTPSHSPNFATNFVVNPMRIAWTGPIGELGGVPADAISIAAGLSVQPR